MKNGWIDSTIGSLAQYLNGRAFKPSEWETEGNPIIRIQNLNSEEALFNYSSKEYDEKYHIKKNDLLFAWSASLGAYIWKGNDAWLNQHIFKVIPYTGIHKTFLYYLLQFITNQFYIKSHGSGMVHITKSEFENTQVYLPPTTEQHRIVAKIEELFSKLDKGIESLKAAQAQLKNYRQSLLKGAFEGKLTATWRAKNADKLETSEQLLIHIQQEREARYQQQLTEWQQAVKEWEQNGKKGKKPTKPKQPKSLTELEQKVVSNLPTIPDIWLWKKLGWMTLGVEYGTSAKSVKSGTHVVLRMGNIQNGKFDWEDLVFTGNKEEIEKYLLKPDDVLFNRTNSPELVGKTAIYKGEKPAIFAGYLIRVNQFHNIVDSQYLNLFLNSAIAKQYGNTVKTDGVNQSNINGEKLINYPFPYCSIQEQQELVKLLESQLSRLDKLEDEIVLSLTKSQSLRQAILKKAFAGELVPQDSNDELASELLNRIAQEKAQLAQEQTKAHNTKKGNKKS